MYEVLIEKSVERELRRLPSEAAGRVISTLKSLRNNPRPKGCRKIVGSQDDWRVRVGDYRIIYEVSDSEKTVKVMRVRHRSSVYK